MKLAVTEKLLTLAETAQRLGVSAKTLRRWDKTGEFPATRTPSGHRRYLQSEVDKRLGIQQSFASVLPVTTYCRVSSHEQKQKGDLERQEGRVLAYCVKRGYSVLQSFTEVGSGMNDKRPRLHALIKLVTGHKVSRVVIEHKDRLTRFNFALYQAFFESHGVEIEWTEEALPKSSSAELVEDIISLMSSCSAKVYGRRSAERRKAKKEAEHEAG